MRDAVTQLIKLTDAAADRRDDPEVKTKWLNEVRGASTGDLIEAVSRLSSDEDHRPATIKALREAIISEIERKNSVHIVETMESLDRSATLLTWVSLALTVVGLVLAGLQIWQGLKT